MRNWLRAIREKRGLSQKQVAHSVEIRQPSYWNIEAGSRNPSVPVAKKIASVLGFDWTMFFETEKQDRFEKDDQRRHP